MASWRERAIPVQAGLDLKEYEPSSPKTGYKAAPIAMEPANMALTDENGQVIGVPADISPPVPDWRKRAESVEVAPIETSQAVPQETRGDRARLLLDQGLQGLPLVGTFTDEATDFLGALGAGVVTGTNPIDLYKYGRDDTQSRINNQLEQHPVASTLAQLSSGIGVGGAVATGTKLGTMANNMLRSGSTAQRIGKGALAGQATGALYGAGSSEDGGMAQGAASGALLGGAFGAGLPALGAAASGTGSALKSIAAPTIEASRLPVAELAKKHNIPLGIDDLTGNEFYKRLISQGESLPGSGAASKVDAQQVGLNKAISRAIGEEAERITPEYIKSQQSRLGGMFQSFTKDKVFEPGADYYSRIDDIKNKASRGGYGRDGKEFLQDNINRITNIMDDGGQIKGDQLDKLRREFAQDARERFDDIGKLSDDLEDVLVNIITDGDPATAKLITDTKYQYKNLKTIQGEAIKDQVDGNIRPATLMGAVKRKFGEDALSQGQAGDLGEIARVAQSMRKLNDSGTSKNQLARNLLTGNVMGMAPTFMFGGPLAALAQGAVSGGAMLANRGLQSRNMNPARIESALKQLSRETKPLKLTVRPSDKRISQ